MNYKYIEKPEIPQGKILRVKYDLTGNTFTIGWEVGEYVDTEIQEEDGVTYTVQNWQHLYDVMED